MQCLPLSLNRIIYKILKRLIAAAFFHMMRKIIYEKNRSTHKIFLSTYNMYKQGLIQEKAGEKKNSAKCREKRGRNRLTVGEGFVNIMLAAGRCQEKRGKAGREKKMKKVLEIG